MFGQKMKLIIITIIKYHNSKYYIHSIFINDPTGLYACLHFDQAGFQKHLLTSCFRV